MITIITTRTPVITIVPTIALTMAMIIAALMETPMTTTIAPAPTLLLISSTPALPTPTPAIPAPPTAEEAGSTAPTEAATPTAAFENTLDVPETSSSYASPITKFRIPGRHYASFLASHMWSLKNEGTPHLITWKILEKPGPCINESKRSKLCMVKQVGIVKNSLNPRNILNSRTEVFRLPILTYSLSYIHIFTVVLAAVTK